jgi:hypothetical protein
MLLRVTQVASLERLLKSYLEGFPRFNLKRKEKEWVDGWFCNRRYSGSPAACRRPEYMKVLAEADLQVPITDILFTKPYIAVGTSVAVTYTNVTNRWIEEYPSGAFLHCPYPFSKSAARLVTTS